MILGKKLSRRAVLRGLGASLSLPLMDAMVPAMASPAARAKAPCRMVFAYVPNGMHMPDRNPAAEGTGFTLPRTLEPQAAYKYDLLVLSGLTHNTGRALGDGPGDHARA